MTHKPRGFAVMPPARQRAIASLGGRTAHQMGTAHEWTPAEAAAAGRRGGVAMQARRRARAEAERVLLVLAPGAADDAC